MFDFGFSELFLLSVIVLVVLGPSRLPTVMRTCGLWLGRMRRVYQNVRQEIEREVGMDDVRRQLHNEQIMAELKAVEKEARTFKQEIKSAGEITLDSPNSPTEAKPEPEPKPQAPNPNTEGDRG